MKKKGRKAPSKVTSQGSKLMRAQSRAVKVAHKAALASAAAAAKAAAAVTAVAEFDASNPPAVQTPGSDSGT